MVTTRLLTREEVEKLYPEATLPPAARSYSLPDDEGATPGCGVQIFFACAVGAGADGGFFFCTHHLDGYHRAGGTAFKEPLTVEQAALPAAVSGLDRKASQATKLQAMCEHAWGEALRLPSVGETRDGTYRTCGAKSPNGYACTRHQDGWHEARNGGQALLETWQIVTPKQTHSEGLAELEADLKKPARIPDPGQHPALRNKIVNGTAAPATDWTRIDQRFRSSGALNTLMGVTYTAAAAKQAALDRAAIQKLEQAALVATFVKGAELSPGGSMKMPAPNAATKAKYTNAELETIYREVMVLKQQERQMEATMQGALLNPTVPTQSTMLKLMAKAFGMGKP